LRDTSEHVTSAAEITVPVSQANRDEVFALLGDSQILFAIIVEISDRHSGRQSANADLRRSAEAAQSIS
jgi:hypothetical protein